MTKEGFKNWHDRALDLCDDLRKQGVVNGLDGILFQMKSGRKISLENTDDFFGNMGEYEMQDNVTIYNNEGTIEVDVESIETITW